MKYLDEIWAMIPARSGSKGVKNKNVKKLHGKPLLAYSIIAAKKSKNISKIIFSSDSQNYYKVACKYGKSFFHKRSKKISGDQSTDFQLFYDFVTKYKGDLPKYFVHLRPTTPFRNSKILDSIILKFIDNNKGYTSLRSVSPISNIIFKTVIINKKKLYSPIYNSFNLDLINAPRQAYGNSYLGNGYIDIIKTKNIFKGFLHGKKVMPYIYKSIVVDIDDFKNFKISKKKKFFSQT